MTDIQYSTLFLLTSVCRERQAESHTKLPPCDFLERSHDRKGRNRGQNGAMFAGWMEREEYMRGGLVFISAQSTKFTKNGNINNHPGRKEPPMFA